MGLIRCQRSCRSGRLYRKVSSLAVGTVLGLVFWLSGFSAIAQVRRESVESEAKWEVLSACQLVTNSAVDGDSFHVMHQGREYVFRLYFVDAPESDATLKERIQDQAAYFGIAPDDIPRAGRQAARFTREKLTGRDITIMTRWQNGLGRSSLVRFYGMVMVNGTNLAEELVANGYARIYGLRANWPDGPRSTTFINKLKNLELDAREKRLGVWEQAALNRTPGENSTEVTNSTAAPVAAPTAALGMDLNAATFDELQTLPGIGPKLAERIIAHRPYQTLDDLDTVPGIGPATIKRLVPLIRITPPTPRK